MSDRGRAVGPGRDDPARRRCVLGQGGPSPKWQITLRLFQD